MATTTFGLSVLERAPVKADEVAGAELENRLRACLALLPDERALAELYDLLARDLFAVALWSTASRSRAEDTVQEVFVRLAARGGGLSGVRSPRTYLLTMARRVAVELSRTEVRHRGEELASDQVEQLVAAIEPNGEARTAARELDRALAALSPKLREAVTLRHLLGLSWSEVAVVTGVSMFTAASRGRLALVRLRRLLGASQVQRGQKGELS